jgi:adenosylcobinamide-GDP ribazoletransferase
MGFFDALSLLTRIPTRAGGDTRRAIPWMPVVGALVGLLVVVVFRGMRLAVAPIGSATVAIAAGIVVTGALHEDGFADCADAFGARAGKERTLEILKDPRLGTYGVLALILTVLARVVAVASMGTWTALAALPSAHALGRASATTVMTREPPATDTGLGSAYKHGHVTALTPVVIAVAIAGGLLGLWGVWAVAVAAAVSFGVSRAAHRRIGGYTGDILGAAEQLTEIGVLLLVASGRVSIPWWHAR